MNHAPRPWELSLPDDFAERHVLMMKDEPNGYIRRLFNAALERR
jgi:hypothetical protein